MATMNTDAKRLAVASVYRNPTWRAKVAKMSDAQVVAIFKRLQDQGVIKV